MINLMKKHFNNKQKVSIAEFSEILKKDKTIDSEYWINNINDLLYALETKNHVVLNVAKGTIQSITILL